MQQLDSLVSQSINQYVKKQSQIDKINKALLLAKQKYSNQTLLDKIDLYDYACKVVISLAEYQSEPETIISALLHKIDDIDDELIKKEYGEDVLVMIKALRKIDNIKKITNYEIDNENFRKIFVALAKDYRVIVIRLAMQEEILNNLHLFDSDFQKMVSEETLDIYSPLAHRLGMFKLKSSLENKSFYFLNRKEYLYIESALKQKEEMRMKTIEKMIKNLKLLLKKNKIEYYSIKGRPKQIYSIYNKMKKKDLNFDELYDLLALRVITKSEVNCYEILGHVHTVYKPIAGKFKDYIAVPKPNLYQSLHTSVIGGDNNIYEIQIRTKEMDEIAESGVAAHWKYKEASKISSQKMIEEQLHWFKDYVSVSESDETSDEYIENLKKDVFETSVYVMSPKGRVIDLPHGSTPVDFAYRIHGNVGHSCVGAKVNGLMVPLSTVLSTGDVVDIKTSKIHPYPSEGWLQFVKTNLAKNSIKKAIIKKDNLENKVDLLEKGNNQILEELKNKEINEKDAMRVLNNSTFLKMLGYNKIEELYLALANKNIGIISLIEKVKNKLGLNTAPVFEFKKKTVTNASNNGIIVSGIDSIKVTLSQCCNPIPGDDIVGFISRGRGVRVHRRECPTLDNENSRLIDVEWDEANITTATNNVDIVIEAGDRNNLLIDIMNTFSTLKVSISSLKAKTHKQALKASFYVSLLVKNNQEYESIAKSIKNISGVFEVKRVTRN